jgi:hypothetical protein
MAVHSPQPGLAAELIVVSAFAVTGCIVAIERRIPQCGGFALS